CRSTAPECSCAILKRSTQHRSWTSNRYSTGDSTGDPLIKRFFGATARTRKRFFGATARTRKRFFGATARTRKRFFGGERGQRDGRRHRGYAGRCARWPTSAAVPRE